MIRLESMLAQLGTHTSFQQAFLDLVALLAMAEGLLSRQSPAPYTQLDSALCVVGQVR